VIVVVGLWYLFLPSKPTGAVALNILPWTEVAKVESDSTGAMALEKVYITPCRVILPAGGYKVTLTHPQFKRPLTVRVFVKTDSVSEIRQQWPGYDVGKVLAEF
jgi:hypothetical protein